MATDDGPPKDDGMRNIFMVEKRKYNLFFHLCSAVIALYCVVARAYVFDIASSDNGLFNQIRNGNDSDIPAQIIFGSVIGGLITFMPLFQMWYSFAKYDDRLFTKVCRVMFTVGIFPVLAVGCILWLGYEPHIPTLSGATISMAALEGLIGPALPFRARLVCDVTE